MGEKILKLGTRRRCSFRNIGRPEDRKYIVIEYPNGTIMLVPERLDWWGGN